MKYLFPSPTNPKDPVSKACSLPKESHWPYPVPETELFPDRPWPKSLCFAADLCPIPDSDISNLSEAEKCPITPVSGCPLFLMCADTFETYAEIEKMEIFEVEVPESKGFTTKDLDEIIANFEKLKCDKILHPPLVIGHGDDQKILRQSGLPSAGWLTQLTRDGKKLYASFKAVPEKIKEVVNKMAYRFPSVEIYKNFEYGGKNFGKVLRRVALLGADIPRIKTLDDISNLYRASEAPGCSWVSSKTETSIEGDMDMTKEELQAMLEGLQTKMEKAVTAQNEKFDEARKAEIAKLETQLTDIKSQLEKFQSSDQAAASNAASDAAAVAVADAAAVADAVAAAQDQALSASNAGSDSDAGSAGSASDTASGESGEIVKPETIDALQAQIDKLVEQNVALQSEMSRQQHEAHFAEIDGFCEDLKKKGMAPAVVDAGTDSVKAFLLSLDWQKKISFGEDSQETTHFDKFCEVFTSLISAHSENKLFIPKDNLDIEEEDPDSVPAGVDAEGLKLHKKIQKFAEENKVSYEEAYETVMDATE